MAAVMPPSKGATAKARALALPARPKAEPCLSAGELMLRSAFAAGIEPPLKRPTSAMKKMSMAMLLAVAIGR
jgi:hypothetical protein